MARLTRKTVRTSLRIISFVVVLFLGGKFGVPFQGHVTSVQEAVKGVFHGTSVAHADAAGDGDGDGDGCCVAAGTKVSMADGSEKNIEDLKKGDLVLAFDEVTGEYKPSHIEGIATPTRDSVFVLNGGTLVLTNDHPLYIEKKDGKRGWGAPDRSAAAETYKDEGIVEVLSLEVGDRIRSLSGMWVEVISLEYQKGTRTMYTVTKSEHKTYFANGFVSHNQAGHPDDGDGAGTDAGCCCCCGDFCLVAGTKITMAGGGEKNIEEIQTGDTVVALDTLSGAEESVAVSEPKRSKRGGVYSVNDGLLRLTNDHPLYVRTRDGVEGWGSVEPHETEEVYPSLGTVIRLTVGDSVRMRDGAWTEVSSLAYETGEQEVYTLASGEHLGTFFANGILTHGF